MISWRLRKSKTVAASARPSEHELSRAIRRRNALTCRCVRSNDGGFEVHDGVQPVAVTAEGQMDRYLVDRLLVRRERYDSVH